MKPQKRAADSDLAVDQAVDFNTAFSSINFSDRPVVLAVSGGSDSMSLLNGYQQMRAQLPAPIVVTVDHGLRNQSAQEAAMVAAYCGDHGMVHITQHWRSNKPATGVQAAARMARYRLLADVAVAHGAQIVLTGHTADDQAEVLAMRGARNATSTTGLSGMAPATLFGLHTWFVRPLMGMARRNLRASLVAQSISWADDASNLSPAYERGRLRLSGAAQGVAARVASHAKARRQEDAAAAAHCISEMTFNSLTAGHRPWPAHVSFPRQGSQGQVVAADYVGRIMAGRIYPLSPDQRGALESFVNNGANGKHFTIGGVRFSAKRDSIEMVIDGRNKGASGFGEIVPLFDWPLLAAVAEKLGHDLPPEPPLAAPY